MWLGGSGFGIGSRYDRHLRKHFYWATCDGIKVSKEFDTENEVRHYIAMNTGGYE